MLLEPGAVGRRVARLRILGVIWLEEIVDKLLWKHDVWLTEKLTAAASSG